MGIKGLTPLLEKRASTAIKKQKIENYFRRRIVIDANIKVYEFLKVIPWKLANDDGKRTSHLVGMSRQVAAFVEAGIDPIYVFDGKPPDSKKVELARREAIREDALRQLNLRMAVKDGGDADTVDELIKKSLRPTPEQLRDLKKLLGLMGVPCIQAPGEAEAQCCRMCRDTKNKVYAVASDDTDCFPFGAPKVLVNFKAKKRTIIEEYDCAKVLKELKLTMNEFIDMCILCGCNYCGSPTKTEGQGQGALDLIRQHGSIQAIVNSRSLECPNEWHYEDAQREFKEPNVDVNVDPKKLAWTKPDEAGLINS